MDGKETEETTALAIRVTEVQEREILVLIVLVPSALSGRILQVREWAAVDVGLEELGRAEREGAWRKRLVSLVNRDERAGDNGIVGLLDEAKRRKLRQEVLHVASNTRMRVCADERNVLLIVQARVDGLQSCDNCPPDSSIPYLKLAYPALPTSITQTVHSPMPISWFMKRILWHK